MYRSLKMLPILLAVLALALSQTASAESGDQHTLKLGLGGYSPVSYFNASGPKPGSPVYQSTHGGVTYFFASADEVKKFNANPDKYTPAYGGWCAFGMAVEGKFEANPMSYKIINGKLKMWNDGDEAELCSKADAYWDSVQNKPSRAYINARNVSGDGVALSGYSPVSYFTMSKPERGSADYAVDHGGVTYWLTSAEQAEQFKKDPDKYAPAFGGWCAFGMSVQDKFPVDPTAFKIVDGKLMLFLRNENIDARELWNKGDARELTTKAAAHWKKVAG